MDAMNTDDLVDALAETPIWLRETFLHLSDSAARLSPGAGQWSAADVLAHLRASDAILAPRVLQILVRAQAPLIGFDERAWAAWATRARLSISTQVEAFDAQRSELVGVLRTLIPAEWAAEGLHETRGALSVRAIVQDLATHEREHRQQMDELLRRIATASTPTLGSKRAGAAQGSANRRRSADHLPYHASV